MLRALRASSLVLVVLTFILRGIEGCGQGTGEKWPCKGHFGLLSAEKDQPLFADGPRLLEGLFSAILKGFMRFGTLVALALTLLIPIAAHGQLELPDLPDPEPCPLQGIIGVPCNDSGEGAEGVQAYLDETIFPAMRILFIATAILMFLQYSIKLLFDPESSETASTTKTAYGYGVTACAIVGIASLIVDAVGQEAKGTLINPEPIEEGIMNIITYMRLVVAVIMTLFILIQGVRLIMKQGNEEEFKNAQTQFFHASLGVAVILLANTLVTAFRPESSPPIGLATEIVGIINFGLTFVGALSLLSILVAGILLVISVDESLKDRAKKAITTSIVGLTVAFLSYVLVHYFVTVQTTTTTDILFGFIDTAHAQELSDIADDVSNDLSPEFSGDGEGGTGADAFAGIAGYLLEQTWLIVGIFTLLMLVRSGIKLIYAQSEDKFEEAKRAVANGLMAVVLVYLTSRFVDAVIRKGGSESEEAAGQGASIFTEELLGIVSWVQTLVAVLAVGMIIAGVASAMSKMGGEDGTTKIRQAVAGSAAGIFVLILDGAFRATFGLMYNTEPGSGTSATPLITGAAVIVNSVLGLMALAGVSVVIYAGIRMVLSVGNEDTVKTMRTLIYRALIGLTVILLAYIVITFVLSALSPDMVIV